MLTALTEGEEAAYDELGRVDGFDQDDLREAVAPKEDVTVDYRRSGLFLDCATPQLRLRTHSRIDTHACQAATEMAAHKQSHFHGMTVCRLFRDPSVFFRLAHGLRPALRPGPSPSGVQSNRISGPASNSSGDRCPHARRSVQFVAHSQLAAVSARPSRCCRSIAARFSQRLAHRLRGLRRGAKMFSFKTNSVCCAGCHCVPRRSSLRGSRGC